jgi:hypothetical protein
VSPRVSPKRAAPELPAPTAPLNSRSRARLTRAAHGVGRGESHARGPGRTALFAAWLALCAAVAGALLTAAPLARKPSLNEPPGAIQRLGPAEDDEPAPDAPSILAARLVALAPAEETPAPDDAPPTGLYLASGGPPQPLRAAPERTAEALVQVPDHAGLDDLGEITPDGAWRHVAWAGWDGWIAAGLLLRRP